MPLKQQKSQIVDNRDSLSLTFKDILCSQNSAKYISAILRIFNSSENVSLSKGNKSPKLYKTYLLGD
jgi:hypothetical protein